MAVAFKQQGIASSGAASTTVAVSLGVAPTAGNLLIFCMGGDKNTGALTLSGFTKLYELLSTSVSLYYYYKVSDGTETTINPSWASSSAAGNMCWYAEYQDVAVSGSSWQVSASASHITDEVITASWATGTTGASTADGLGVAVATIDSSQSWTSATTWTNSYVSRYDGTGGGGRGAVFLSEHAELSGATASSTFGYTGTSDQVSAAIAIWTKLGGTAQTFGSPATPLVGLKLPGQPATAPPIGPTYGPDPSTFAVETPLPISQFLHPLSLVLGARLFPAPQPITPPSGAQVFNQALTATVTSAASIVNSVGKLLSATATSTASLVKQVGKPLTATVTSTATLVALKVKTVAMSATVTTTATLIKSVGKPLSATSTTSASIVKQVGKTLSATVTSTATMLTIKAKNLVMTATVTTTATIVRQVGKPLSSTVTSTASLVKSVGKKLTATSTTTATMVATRAFLKTLTATVTTTASISRSVGKKLNATVTTSASITKQVAIRLSATVSSTASLVATFTGLSALRTLFFGRNRPRGGIGQGSPGAGGFGRNQPHGGTGQGSPDAQEFAPPSPEQEQ